MSEADRAQPKADWHTHLPVVSVTGYPDREPVKQATPYAPVMLLAQPANAKLLERTMRSVPGDRRLLAVHA
jgi:hypothetical protein